MINQLKWSLDLEGHNTVLGLAAILGLMQHKQADEKAQVRQVTSIPGFQF